MYKNKCIIALFYFKWRIVTKILSGTIYKHICKCSLDNKQGVSKSPHICFVISLLQWLTTVTYQLIYTDTNNICIELIVADISTWQIYWSSSKTNTYTLIRTEDLCFTLTYSFTAAPIWVRDKGFKDSGIRCCCSPSVTCISTLTQRSFLSSS